MSEGLDGGDASSVLASTWTQAHDVQTGTARRGQDLLRSSLRRFGIVWVLLVVVVVAQLQFSGFLEPGNISDLFSQTTPIALIAIGSTFVIIGGGFDLSVGAIFAGATVCYATYSNHLPLPLAMVLTVATASCAGAFNGVLITVFRINTFIATLGSSSVFVGLIYRIATDDNVVSTAPGFQGLGTTRWLGVWVTTFVLLGLTVLAALVLHRTTYGQSVYAVGGNPEAARLSGKRVSWYVVSTYVISAAAAGIAGIIAASQTGVGQASIGGSTALDAITIVIVGGTSLLGGEGAIWRTVVGALILATITDVFESLGVAESARLIVTGGILIAAVALDTLARRRRA